MAHLHYNNLSLACWNALVYLGTIEESSCGFESHPPSRISVVQEYYAISHVLWLCRCISRGSTTWVCHTRSQGNTMTSLSMPSRHSRYTVTCSVSILWHGQNKAKVSFAVQKGGLNHTQQKLYYYLFIKGANSYLPSPESPQPPRGPVLGGGTRDWSPLPHHLPVPQTGLHHHLRQHG